MERKNLFSKMSSPSSEHDFRALSPVTGIPDVARIWLCAGVGALLTAAAPSSSENPARPSAVLVLPCGVSKFAGWLRVLMASSLPRSPWCTWVLGWWSVPQVQCGVLIRPLRESQISTASRGQASRRRLLHLILIKSILSAVSPFCLSSRCPPQQDSS